MAYNRHIGHSAPLPTGALPTQEEMSTLRHQAWDRDVRNVRRAIGRLFK
tara:strand:+ start:1951 stop:2097 length:147 start_codon:yes stop_codon:yes gene_type:complete